MSSVLSFPSFEDRTYIHNLINHHSNGKCSRDDMMRWIEHILDKYKVKRMPIFGYSVRVLQWYKGLPIVSIEASEVSEKCPGCGSDSNHSKYLRTEKENEFGDRDIISVTCLECSCVYLTEGIKN